MRFIKLILILSLAIIPLNNAYSGFGGTDGAVLGDSDTTGFANTGQINQISAYYDLRERSSYIQITNINSTTIPIHVQIFQHDRQCDELNFNDTLTPNDTVIYNMDDIVRNNGSDVPVNLNDDSYGYVVVSIDNGTGLLAESLSIIGNFRIIDNVGYEYRVNMAGIQFFDGLADLDFDIYMNFNTVDGAMWADVVGYSYYFSNVDSNGPVFASTVRNLDVAFPLGIFVYDLAEEPLSCDQKSFVCGDTMVYGINEDYPASKGDPLLCPGGGLANPGGGFIQMLAVLPPPNPFPADFINGIFVGLIGINNGNGTGSMDYFHLSELDLQPIG